MAFNVTLSVIMSSDVMLNDIMLSVMAPLIILRWRVRILPLSPGKRQKLSKKSFQNAASFSVNHFCKKKVLFYKFYFRKVVIQEPACSQTIKIYFYYLKNYKFN
jgi:hypothetical protein